MILEVLLIWKGFIIPARAFVIIMSTVIWKYVENLPAFFFSLALTLLFVVFYLDIPKITASISALASFAWLLQKDDRSIIKVAEEEVLIDQNIERNLS
jgi:hypothetical protein